MASKDVKVKKVKVKKTKKPTLKEEIELLKDENNKLKDHLLRKMAEFENFRKRSEKEITQIYVRSDENFLVNLLPILDNLERSLTIEDDKEHKESFREGIELIYSDLSRLLTEKGLKIMNTDGQEFDPHLHDAMVMIDSKDVKSNHIVQTFEKGYTFKDRVIRHAKVTVSK